MERLDSEDEMGRNSATDRRKLGCFGDRPRRCVKFGPFLTIGLESVPFTWLEGKRWCIPEERWRFPEHPSSVTKIASVWRERGRQTMDDEGWERQQDNAIVGTRSDPFRNYSVLESVDPPL